MLPKMPSPQQKDGENTYKPDKYIRRTENRLHITFLSSLLIP